MGITEVEIADPEAAPEPSPSPEASPPSGDGPRLDRAPPEEFWNLPNTITTLRIGIVPLLFLLPFFNGPAASRFYGWFFIVAALSDILDGWLARRGAQVTRIGKLLDPLADKLLVSTALIMMVAIGRIPTWAAWMVVVIVGREMAVTGLRGIASTHGHVMAADWRGKLKTIAQNAAAVALLLHYPVYGLPTAQIGLTLLGIATALTLWSGYSYFADYFGWRTAD